MFTLNSVTKENGQVVFSIKNDGELVADVLDYQDAYRLVSALNAALATSTAAAETLRGL